MKTPGSNAIGFDTAPKWTAGAICVACSLLVHALFAPFPKFSNWTRPRLAAAAGFAPSGLVEIPVSVVSDASESTAALARQTPTPPEPPAPVPDPGSVSEPSLASSAAPRPKQPARARESATGSVSGPASRPGLDVAARANSNSSHEIARALASDCSVSLLLDLASLRAHSRAPHLRQLIGQWQPFLATEALDPLRDFERLLVVGPELRASGRGIAVAMHHLDAQQMHAAITHASVRRNPPGSWLESALPTAVEHGEQGDRFYTQLTAELLLIAPERVSLRRTVVELPAPPAGSLGTVYIDDPHRALAALPFEVPRTLHWIRGVIQSAGADAIAIDIEAGDESAELAKHDAQTLTRALASLKTKARAPMIDRARFEAIGGVVVGRLEVTPTQIDVLLDVLSELVSAAPERPPSPEAKAEDEPSDADPSDPASAAVASETKPKSDGPNAPAPVADGPASSASATLPAHAAADAGRVAPETGGDGAEIAKDRRPAP